MTNNTPTPLTFQELDQIYKALGMVRAALLGEPVTLFPVGDRPVNADTLIKQLAGNLPTAEFTRHVQVAILDHLQQRISMLQTPQSLPRIF